MAATIAAASSHFAPEMPEHMPKLDVKIGRGSFGEIYKGLDCKTGRVVAVKLEPVTAEFPQLFHEAAVLRDLAGGRGIPEVYQVEKTEHHNVMAMECLGSSLEALFNTCNRKFSLKTVLMVAIQLIDRVEYIHSKNYLHRDIKPDNFLIGSSQNSRLVYAIDFGLAKKYKVQGRHVRYSANHDLTGTARYASINALRGSEQGRRDDLESVGYLLLYFLRGSLPWQGLKPLPPPKRQKTQPQPQLQPTQQQHQHQHQLQSTQQQHQHQHQLRQHPQIVLGGNHNAHNTHNGNININNNQIVGLNFGAMGPATQQHHHQQQQQQQQQTASALRKKKRQKYDLILQRKIEITPEELCFGHPDEFVEYFKYVRQLKFDGVPDYEYLRSLFRRVWDREKFVMDYVFDWIPSSNPQEKSRTLVLDQQHRPHRASPFLENPVPHMSIPNPFLEHSPQHQQQLQQLQQQQLQQLQQQHTQLQQQQQLNTHYHTITTPTTSPFHGSLLALNTTNPSHSHFSSSSFHHHGLASISPPATERQIT